MGIRFTCHVCTKRLNVKAFLAGKRGICPHCGAKVEIPWETQPDETAAAPTAAPRSVAGARMGGMNGTAAPAVPAVPMPASPTGNGQAAKVTAHPPAPLTATPVARAATAAPTSAPAVESPPPERPRDPIDEAPHAVWYVRPPTGGQYGPASGEIMRKWVGEGRVSSDSLIWREGWADWKTAASQFPEMAGGPGGAPAVAPPPSTMTAPTGPSIPGSTGVAPTGPARPYTRRKSNNSLALVLVIVLTLAALGLLGIFFAVVTAWS